jgi:serine/threonine protein kinase
MPRDPLGHQHSVPEDGFAMPRLKAGQRLFKQRYELRAQLGAGGMGVVWLARDHTERTQVALKFLPTVMVLQEDEMARLRDEVRAGKELRHPRIVATYGLEVEDGHAAIVMEYVLGHTLKELLLQEVSGFFEPEEIAPWVRDIAEALDYLHREARRIHRDLKPANVMIDAKGRARLMDFGISHRMKESLTRQGRTVDGNNTSSSTLAYASPQQLAGKPGHPGDDIYSFGAMMYELLTGTPPFYRGDAHVVGYQISTQRVTPIQVRRQELACERTGTAVGQPVPEPVEKIILACLAKKRDQRPEDVMEVVRAFTPPKPTSLAALKAKVLRQVADLPTWALPVGAAAGVLVGVYGFWNSFARPTQTRKLPPRPVPVQPAPQTTSGKTQADEQAALPGPKTMDEPPPKPPPAVAQDNPPPQQPPVPTTQGTTHPPAAAQGLPFMNSLGMRFLPTVIYQDGRKVLCSIWETRARDYAVFVKETGHPAGEAWTMDSFKGAPVGRGETERVEESYHPAANVSAEDADAFCAWLTRKERAAGLITAQMEYRLPTDMEWSFAVGVGEREDARESPKIKDGKYPGIYPWGVGWPPPSGGGNFADGTAKARFGELMVVEGYVDDHAATAPAGSFKPNALGLYDMGGNLSEWTSSTWEPESPLRVLRGASWFDCSETRLRSTSRARFAPNVRLSYAGFRCVLALPSSS